MIDIVVDEGVDMDRMPNTTRIVSAIQAVFATVGVEGDPDLCIRFALDEDVRQLNQDWLGKDKVTDVLSFPMQEGSIDPASYLGDIALAVSFVECEAERLRLPAADHAIHLIVHGLLHLLGHDHEGDAEAANMQALEREVLAGLGLHDPYPEDREEKVHVG